MAEVLDYLEEVGLTKNEARVYLALLKKGQLRAGEISRETQINRSSVYEALEHLIKKGLVSYVVVSKRKVFKAVNPKRLLEWLKEKEENLTKIMPILEKLHETSKTETHLTLYEGYKGVQSIFQDIIRKKRPIDCFGSEGQLNERMPWYAVKFVKTLKEERIPVRMIVRKGRKDAGSNLKNVEVRYFPLKVKSNVVTNIYGNKIAIIVWTEKPMGVIIENKEAAEAYRNFFEFMWARALKNEKRK